MIQKRLRVYRSKRDFSQTREPQGERSIIHNPPIFVVQKHNASHLHYDFRLEIQGVLKSWAVPKGPPLKVGEKRLAIETEDHPLEYAEFEGTIPPGHYGAGTVQIWDHGTFSLLKENLKPEEAYKSGRLEIIVRGKKLKGPYALIRTDFKGAKNSWLLLKMKTDKSRSSF